jgi:hypothetical protein
MSDDLYEVWRDDRLIEAAARGDLVELENDPAAGPLLALTELADSRPLPRLDIDGAALVDSRRNHRYAVRSLAVAVTAVATLSTSGVAAVVTGDPFRPAKAVWHQIEDHTGLRADGDDAQAGSAAALGGPAGQPVDAADDAPMPSSALLAGGSPLEGITARAPVRMDEQRSREQAGEPDGARSLGDTDPAGEGTQPTDAERDARQSQEQDSSGDSPGSTESDPAEPSEPTDPEQQEPGDDSDSEPAPQDQQPAPDDGSDGDLDDLVQPQEPDQDDPRTRPVPTLPEDGVADRGQVLRAPLSGAAEDTTDGSVTNGTAQGTTGKPTDTGTLAPPPTFSS